MWVKFLKAGTSAIYFGDNLSRGIKKWLILKKKHIQVLAVISAKYYRVQNTAI